MVTMIKAPKTRAPVREMAVCGSEHSWRPVWFGPHPLADENLRSILLVGEALELIAAAVASRAQRIASASVAAVIALRARHT